MPESTEKTKPKRDLTGINISSACRAKLAELRAMIQPDESLWPPLTGLVEWLVDCEIERRKAKK